MKISNIEMEVLGYMFVNEKNMIEVMPYVKRENFTSNSGKKLFDIIEHIYENYDNITPGTIEASSKELKLNINANNIYKTLVSIGSKVKNIDESIKILKENYVQYQSEIIFDKYQSLIRSNPEKINEYSQKMNDELYELQNTKEETQVELIGKGIHDFIESKKNISIDNSEFIYTGFQAIDEKIVGTKRGEVVVIGGRPGSGKAQPLYSKILTPDGWVRMGDIKVGDKVINTYGGISKVDGVFPQGVMDIYEVMFDDGTSIRTTKDHLWFVTVGGSDMVMTLSDIMELFDKKNFFVKNHSKIDFSVFSGSNKKYEVYFKDNDLKSLSFLKNMDFRDIVAIDDIQNKIEKLAYRYNGKLNIGDIEIAEKVAFMLRCSGYKVEINNGNLIVSKDARRIITISYVGKEEAQCISVSAVNSLYITDNNTITHNTSFALNMITNMAKAGKNVLFFSLEMKKDSLAERLLAAESGIPLKNIRSGEISPDDYERLHEAGNRIEKLPIHLVKEYEITIKDLKNIAHHYKNKFNIDVIALDYLQLLENDKDGMYQNEHLRIKEIMRSIKILANKLDVVFIVLSQLRRDIDDRENKRPRMSDLKESGSIEETADFIMFLYRGKYYNKDSPYGDLCEVDIAKGRQAGSYLVNLEFIDYLTTFRDVQREIVIEPENIL